MSELQQEPVANEAAQQAGEPDVTELIRQGFQELGADADLEAIRQRLSDLGHPDVSGKVIGAVRRSMQPKPAKPEEAAAKPKAPKADPFAEYAADLKKVKKFAEGIGGIDKLRQYAETLADVA